MIRFDESIKKVSKKLKVPRTLVKKVLKKTFQEIESCLNEDKNFMFKGYIKFVQAKNKKKPISKTELFNLKTKDK